MLKNVIAPIQAWLLSQGKCVGCGMPLAGAKREKFKGDTEKVHCKCRRIYIFDTKKKTYRRALLEEV
ncbi:MAG: hypothetical protein AAB546_04835 [Patescibacteria group bacterium]